jgi:hypothetical protein
MLENLNRLDRFSDREIEGLGLSVSEVRAVARRQLTGSIFAGILVIAVTAVIGLRQAPNSMPEAMAASHGVQQPVFAGPPGHVVASLKHKIEAP